MVARRRRLDPLRLAEAGGAVAELVLRAPAVKAASRVAFYAATGGEVPTRPVFEALEASGHERLLPRVRGEALEWAVVDDWALLSSGSFGVPEPEGPAVAPPGPGDVVLVPGLAFDDAGRRLGRGGGYYDRAFPRSRPAPLLVGLAHAFQVVSAVPHGSRDRRVDAIVTERGWIWTRESG